MVIMRIKTIIQIALVMLLLPLLLMGVGPWPGAVFVQAAARPPLSATMVQSRGTLTIYLPIIHQSPPPVTPESELLDLINAERQRLGVSRLVINPLLMQTAEAHSQDMVDRHFFSHTNPDGLDPGDRLDLAGYEWGAYGETIGAGYPTPRAIFEGWMNSPGHKAIMLSANYTEIGLGYVVGGNFGHYWTADFGRPGA